MSLSNLTIPPDLKCNSRIFRIAVMKMMSEISGEDYQFLAFSDDGFNRALRLFTKGMTTFSECNSANICIGINSFIIASQNMHSAKTWMLSDLIDDLSYYPNADVVIHPSKTFKKMFDLSVLAIKKYGYNSYTRTITPVGIDNALLHSKVSFGSSLSEDDSDAIYAKYINQVMSQNDIVVDYCYSESMLRETLEVSDGFYDPANNLLVVEKHYADESDDYTVYPRHCLLTAKMLLDPDFLWHFQELGKTWREERDFYDSYGNPKPKGTSRIQFPRNLDFSLLIADKYRKEHARNREKTVYMSDIKYVSTGGAFG